MSRDDGADQDMAMAVYESESGAIELRLDVGHETVWATQANMAAIFGVDRSVISKHVANVFTSNELQEKSNVQKMHIPSSDKPLSAYSLEVVISVGYRVNSITATRFRQWATATLKEYISCGYVLNAARLAAEPETLRRLSGEIRKVRLSEQAAYASVREVFKMSASDYEKDSPAARSFFAMTQDKFHYAVTGKTAAQIVLERADANKPNMGLMTMNSDQPTREDVIVGKNYLDADELHYLENICEQFMLFCESQAMRGRKMTMEELSFRLNTMLTANDYPVLYEYGKYLRKDADKHAQKQLHAYLKGLKAPKKTPRLKPGTPSGKD